ncbi:MAG TPA: IPT/TIG domain-containing protein, partial [Terriglobales bacterium]
MMSQFHFHSGSDRRGALGRVLQSQQEPGRDAGRRLTLPTRKVPLTVLLAALLILILFLLVQFARAGGPKYVAGASFFDPASKGTPVIWSQGTVDYYTDPGSLSAYVSHAGADAMVQVAFDRWSLVTTSALVTRRAGPLAEDVNGSNVTGDGTGAITMPADVTPSATSRPVGVVYDADGAVTDALLGTGAGASDECFTNAVFGGPDNFSADGHITHALVVLNGNCVQNSSQYSEALYRLVRVVGRVLGLDWAQLNWRVTNGSPSLTPADYTGLPLMHPTDPIYCAPIAVCNPTADQLRMDDRAAISRLYPVTPENLGNFMGKHPFGATTGRIYGTVYFSDQYGGEGQPMQGVNVVARWIDPSSGSPSRQYAAASVSGFLFRGNAGNAITGYTSGSGQNLDRFGSDDAAVEGFFDLAGLEFPDGHDTAQYEVTIEAIDPLWSQSVGPYGPWQVQPSGTSQPVRLTVNRGDEVRQDIIVPNQNDAVDAREPESFDSPASVPVAGDWAGSLSGYGDGDYYWLSGQGNRTLSVEVTAMDEAGVPSQDKARPVIGMWSLAAPAGTPPPAASPAAFNVASTGMTRLDAVLLANTNFRIGIVDERGDGRPDYQYRARVLYGDRITPSRVSAGGGTVMAVDGMGFRAGVRVTVGGVAATVRSLTSHR